MNVWEEDPNCINCRYYAELTCWDYTKIGTNSKWKSGCDGFVCMAYAFEGEGSRLAIHMLGVDPEEEHCEMFKHY